MLYNAALNNATLGMPGAGRVAGIQIPLQPASHEATSTSVQDQPRTVLVADPVGVIAQALGPVLVQYIGCRVVHARTVAQVHKVIEDGVKGELAVVSLSLSHQAPAVIHALRGSGWPRVLALTMSGLPLASAIGAVDAGAMG